MVWIKGMYYANECPHKGRSASMWVYACISKGGAIIQDFLLDFSRHEFS